MMSFSFCVSLLIYLALPTLGLAQNLRPDPILEGVRNGRFEHAFQLGDLLAYCQGG